MLWPKINSFKEFDTPPKFLRLENSPLPPTPHNFSNGLSLKCCRSGLTAGVWAGYVPV